MTKAEKNKEKNRRLKKFLTYDVKKLKSALEEIKREPGYHDADYVPFQKRKRKRQERGLESNLHRRDRLR